MATTRILLGIVCIAVVCSFTVPAGHLLAKRQPDAAEMSKRKQLIAIARAEIGVKERSGHNDGERVEAYLATVKLKKGNPWCAAYLSWVFQQAGYPAPRSGWSPDLFPRSRLTTALLPGNVLGIYFPQLGRIAHVGLLERVAGDYCITLEGNTNISGARDGDGVYRKRRHRRTIYRYADWLQAKSATR